MTYRLRNIVVAVALALVAALMTMFYVTNYQRNVEKDAKNVEVFVAKNDIPVGTSGADLARKGLLEKSEIVRRSVVPGAISSPDQLSDLVAVQPVYAGEQVSTRRFALPTTRGISARLTGTQRAISFQGDKEQLLAGTLKKDDRVDVVASFKHNSVEYTRLILRDVLVLKAPTSGASSDKLASGREGAFAVMLAVTDVQVQKLHWADTFADAWHLELRPVTDAVDSPENVESSKSLLLEGVRPRQLDQAGYPNAGALGGTP